MADKKKVRAPRQIRQTELDEIRDELGPEISARRIGKLLAAVPRLLGEVERLKVELAKHVEAKDRVKAALAGTKKPRKEKKPKAPVDDLAQTTIPGTAPQPAHPF